MHVIEQTKDGKTVTTVVRATFEPYFRCIPTGTHGARAGFEWFAMDDIRNMPYYALLDFASFIDVARGPEEPSYDDLHMCIGMCPIVDTDTMMYVNAPPPPGVRGFVDLRTDDLQERRGPNSRPLKLTVSDPHGIRVFAGTRVNPDGSPAKRARCSALDRIDEDGAMGVIATDLDSLKTLTAAGRGRDAVAAKIDEVQTSMALLPRKMRKGAAAIAEKFADALEKSFRGAPAGRLAKQAPPLLAPVARAPGDDAPKYPPGFTPADVAEARAAKRDDARLAGGGSPSRASLARGPGDGAPVGPPDLGRADDDEREAKRHAADDAEDALRSAPPAFARYSAYEAAVADERAAARAGLVPKERPTFAVRPAVPAFRPAAASPSAPLTASQRARAAASREAAHFAACCKHVGLSPSSELPFIDALLALAPPPSPRLTASQRARVATNREAALAKRHAAKASAAPPPAYAPPPRGPAVATAVPTASDALPFFDDDQLYDEPPDAYDEAFAQAWAPPKPKPLRESPEWREFWDAATEARVYVHRVWGERRADAPPGFEAVAVPVVAGATA